jgi:hypothetical protein
MANVGLIEITLNEIEHDPLLSYQAVNWTEDMEKHYEKAFTKISRNVIEGFKIAFNKSQFDEITCPLYDYGTLISNMIDNINLITLPSVLFQVSHLVTEIEIEGWTYKMFINRHTEIITFSIKK